MSNSNRKYPETRRGGRRQYSSSSISPHSVDAENSRSGRNADFARLPVSASGYHAHSTIYPASASSYSASAYRLSGYDISSTSANYGDSSEFSGQGQYQNNQSEHDSSGYGAQGWIQNYSLNAPGISGLSYVPNHKAPTDVYAPISAAQYQSDPFL